MPGTRRLSSRHAVEDHVFSILGVEHIPEDGDSRTMREIRRVRCPGGMLALAVPFAASG